MHHSMAVWLLPYAHLLLETIALLVHSRCAEMPGPLDPESQLGVLIDQLVDLLCRQVCDCNGYLNDPNSRGIAKSLCRH